MCGPVQRRSRWIACAVRSASAARVSVGLVKEARARLVVAVLMHDQGGKHSATGYALFGGDFAEQVEQSRVVVLKLDGMNLFHEL